MSRGPKKLKRGRLKWARLRTKNKGRKPAKGKRKKFKTFDQVRKQR